MKGTIRSDIEAVMDRIMRFHASGRPGQALIDVNVPVETSPRPNDAPPRRKLNEWAFPEELYAYLDQRFPDPEPHWQARQQIRDDRIPVTCPHFGIVEHYAFLGNEVTFTEAHSWGHPVVTSWDKLASLELSEDALWFRILMDAYDHLMHRMGDRMVPCLRGLMLPMDLANAIRGDDFFMDLYTYPQ